MDRDKSVAGLFSLLNPETGHAYVHLPPASNLEDGRHITDTDWLLNSTTAGTRVALVYDKANMSDNC